MSSTTYTLSQFTKICDVAPEEALAMISSDIWFEKNKSNPDVNVYIKFTINNKKITFISSLNNIYFDNSDYVKVDKNIKINELTLDKELTIEELASIIFSVNQNYKVFEILKNFLVNTKKTDPFSFESIKYSNKMKCFCVHMAHIIANTSENHIPEWLTQDPLFSELSKMYESIHLSKLKINNIPRLENCEKLFVSSMYLSFMIVYDKAKDMQSIKPTLPLNITKLLQCLVIDLNKANNIFKLI